MSWIDPNLLQLIGRGTRGDAQVPDGKHLRWFFGRLLGFPRRGFLLRRHPSYLKANWDPSGGDPIIRQQFLSSAALGTASPRRYPSGLTVSHAGGFTYDGGNLRLDNNPVILDFGPEGPGPVFPPGQFRVSPAAFVRINIVRRQRTGFVVASGYYDGHGRYRFLDRARAGREAVAGFPGLPNPLVNETLLLHGGLLEHVEITGHDASILRVQWITVRDYAAAPGWTELERFFLPLTDAPAIYPAWSTDPGKEIARKRLQRGVRTTAPLAQAPWDDPVTPVTAADLTKDAERRYLDADDAFAGVDEAMRVFLGGELSQFVPQALVEVRQQLEPTEGNDEEDIVDTVTYPFDFVYGASADPRMARILGLMTTDTFAPNETFDYVVTADFPGAWIDKTLFPRRKPGDFGRGQNCLSLATGIAEQVAPPPAAPEDLQARLIPDVSRNPVQAYMELDWRAETASLFENADRARVFYALRREGADGAVLVHEREPVSKLLMPHHPTARVPHDPRRRIKDTTVPKYGPYTWRLTGMDVWGRLTPEASVTAEVRDVIPPPAPVSLEAVLHGVTSDAPNWPELSVAFDWTAAQQLIAPDLDRFEIQLPAMAPLVVSWPALAITSSPSGVTATAESANERIVVRVRPVHAPFDANGEATVSVTVRAVDRFANAGPFTPPAIARRIDDTPPVVPPLPEDIAWTTRPDAEGRAFHRVAWPDLGGGRVRVLRASETALLSVSGSDAAAFEALTQPQRAGFLRGLALETPEAFAPDHEQRYAASAGSHAAQFEGGYRGLTVFVVQPVSAAEVRAPWPADAGAFLVVAVTPPARPRTPLVREVRTGDRRVSIIVARDLTGVTARLRLYRSRRIQDLDDVRAMRPVTELIVAAGTDDLLLADANLYADVEYWYRVTAHAEDGTASAPTEALRARPFTASPPDAPELVSVERDEILPHVRVVTCVVARRDYPAMLLRRPRGTLAWVGTPVDFTSSMPVPGGGYQIAIEDTPPAAADPYLYRLQVQDPRGRIAESNVLEEAP